VRRLEFLVPQHLAAARLKARLLRQKLVEPATTASGQALAGWVRVTLELQDYVRGEYVVILEHDRLLSADRQTVALPVIETGRTDRRLLALENAGRDELVIAPADVAGLAPVTRHEQAWRDLTAVLGTQLTQAYAALDSAERPQLAFSLLRRQEAERSRARIGLATTALVVDASGAYRAEVEYRVTNSSEQYLELALPAGARLWTATVAGEPVKPSQAIPPQPQVVRIPLVKTAEGEGDYPVELKYGGRIPLSAARSIDFPLIRQTSIHVELSHVRLWLPKSHRWLHFGGTMRRVEDDSELAAGFQTYLNKRIQDAVQSLSTASDYAKVRAAVNLKQARELLDQSRVQLGDAPADGGRAAGDLALRNEALLRQAEQQAQLELGQQQAAQPDNRQRLNEYFFRKEQEIERSKNVVTDLASNFDAALGQPAPQNGAVNRGWFEQNKLQSADSRPLAEPRLRSRDDRLGAADGAQRGRYLRGGQQLADQPDAASQPPQALPQIAGMKEVDELERRLDRESAKEDRGGARQSQLRRYQESLEQSAAQSGPVPGAEQLGFAPAGRGPQAGGFSGGAPGPGQAALPQRQANAPFGALAPSSGEQLALVTAGLASLDVQLPERGELYRFTTPRGAVEITARAVPTDTLNRLSRLLLVLVAAAAGLVVLRRTR
jgi:hypothetical protein